jgi:Uma2 family endonuclease
VTIAEAWPAPGRPFTVAELDRMPDDGRRYELLAGVLVVSPWPTIVHQAVMGRLTMMLASTCPEHLCVLPGPALYIDPQTEFAPDAVVVPMDLIGGAKLTEPPLLVAEVCSPSTSFLDLSGKKLAYERFGVPSYWIVDPDIAQPELTVFELRDRRYETVARTTAPVTVERPFRVTVDPSRLTRGLRR